jgi:hypothetical protein
MSVAIERDPGRIKEIRVPCDTSSRDFMQINLHSDGTATFTILEDHSAAAVYVGRDHLDTLLQALAEIRGDLATRPF